ncbi:hypothetical protein, partial [Prevotella sp.]|uniref:hypothetical protein n=2 Tax=Prevotella sp. TaxID=59823 RepID=UPI0027E23292
IFKCASNIILLWEQINPLVSPFFLSQLFIHKLRFIDDGSSCFFVHILFTNSSVLGIKNLPKAFTYLPNPLFMGV